MGSAGVAAAGAGAVLLPSPPAAATPAPTALAGRGGNARTPKVLRSRQALGLSAPAASLPITQHGTTYEMAQETRWLDAQHFAVGRWDGSMSVFQFETAPYVGPVIARATSDPASQGVEMLTKLAGGAIVTSNDYSSLALWHAPGGDWSRLDLRATCSYDSSLGYATAGAALASGTGTSLVVGHSNGYLSIWNYAAASRTLSFVRSVDVRNPSPTNPWDDHTIEDVVPAGGTVVAAGSEDGYVTFYDVSSATVLSQTVFNPAAQRGINALAMTGARLLVANCAVGPDDHNLWYYAVDRSSWTMTLLDKANLVIDTSLPQVFNFDLAWGRNAGAPCWFASTEEGALWMGSPAGHSVNPVGYQQLTGPLGSALAYRDGQLVMVSYDLYQFSTTP
ncbi:MAG TPA: hypothetical protein VMB79_12290 [Jatrophihabitans sp.]|nr:hypothetical protein [Jatrophihabitans sp.]